MFFSLKIGIKHDGKDLLQPVVVRVCGRISNLDKICDSLSVL